MFHVFKPHAAELLDVGEIVQCHTPNAAVATIHLGLGIAVGKFYSTGNQWFCHAKSNAKLYMGVSCTDFVPINQQLDNVGHVGCAVEYGWSHNPFGFIKASMVRTITSYALKQTQIKTWHKYN